jgi:hypothetical protein
LTKALAWWLEEGLASFCFYDMTLSPRQALLGAGIAAAVGERAKLEMFPEADGREVATAVMTVVANALADDSESVDLLQVLNTHASKDAQGKRVEKSDTDEETDETGEGDDSTDETIQLFQDEEDGEVTEASSDDDGWFADFPDSVSCHSEGSMDSMVDHYDRDQTIIIFDWDDTICPTTRMNEETAKLASFSEEAQYEEPADLNDALEDLAVEARKTLERAREVAAEVVIITNATEGWVESSCEHWLPGLRATIDTVQIASARSTWEPLGITTPTGWKAKEFEEVIRKFYSRYWRQSWKNVIVIGDACYEHEALAQVAKIAPQGHGKCRAKSIRFALQPSVELLTRELQMLRESFQDIVYHDDSLEVCYRAESL